MTLLEDHSVAGGPTMRPTPPPYLPGLAAAEDFYRRDLGSPRRQVRIQLFRADGSIFHFAWVDCIEHELNTLLLLEEGWDGRRAKGITGSALDSATAILVVLMASSEGLILPQLFPLPDGGIQIEWHADGDDIEIETDAVGEAHVLATTHTGDVAVEGILAPDLSSPAMRAVADLLKSLSARVAEASQA